MSASSTPSDPAPRTLATAGLPRRVRKALEHALALVSIELDPQLTAMLGEFEQELFRLADLARNPGMESGYMQALRILRLNRSDLVPRFMLELEAGLAAIRSNASATAAAHEQRVSFRNLSLVEDTVMDESTVLREIALRQESRASLSLHLMGQRFGVMAGAPAFDAERLPLGPQALCRAMRDASQTLQVDYDARLLLYHIFDRQVMAHYAQVLEKLDETIAANGVLPGLTFVPVRVRATAQNEPRPRADNVPPQAGAPSATPDRSAPAPARPGGASEASAPHTAWMGEPRAARSTSDEQASLALLQQLMSGRHDLIGKLRPSRPGDTRLELSTSDIFDALGDLQSQGLSSATGSTPSLNDIKQNLLAQIRQRRGHGATLSQKDNDTFELLNMLYGQIEGDIRADAPAAVLLRRLQLPLLRVALRDRAFFVRGRHPARELLNTVAESAARWLDKDDFDPRLLLPLQQAVTHVVEHYNGDDAVFEASNQQLDHHLQAQIRKAEMLERRHVEAARGKEKLQVAKQRAADTLTAAIGEQRLPKFARALLSQAWADVLTLTLLRQGDDSEDWRRQLDVTRQIIVACSRGDGAADPALAEHIEAALAQVGYHADEAGIIAQRLTSSGNDDDDPASRTELTMKLKARTRLGEDSVQARKPTLPPRTPEEQARYEQLRVMPFGVWIEFVTNQQAEVVRRRLSWYSPVTDNALFVNQRGQRIGEQSLDSLARMLANGQARIVTVEQGRLVDRAWQAALSALRSFAGRGDNHALLEPK